MLRAQGRGEAAATLRAPALLGAVVVSSCIAAGCASETGIRLTITSDLAVPEVLDAIRLVVAPYDMEPDPARGIGIDQTFDVRAPGTEGEGYVLPVTLGIRPYRGDADRTIRMEAQARLAPGAACDLQPAIQHRRFVEDEVLEVTLELARACCGFTGCASTETCVTAAGGGPACVPRADGSFDAGAPSDAGPRDAGPRDAGPRDVGPRDVGPDVRCVPTDETCNGRDDDCNDEIDDGVMTTFYRDADGDGSGREDDTVDACDAPDGYVAAAGDCDDDDGSRHPGAEEGCDDVDDDCSGDAPCDSGCACCTGDTRSCGTDVGECVAGTEVCTNGSWGSCSGDTGPSTEICDGLDNDCNDTADGGDVCERAVSFDTTIQIGGASGSRWDSMSGDDEFGSNGPCVTITGSIRRSPTSVTVEVCCRMEERSGDSCTGTLRDSIVSGCDSVTRTFANTGLDSEQPTTFRAQYADTTTDVVDTSIPVMTSNPTFSVLAANGDTNNEDVCYDQDEPGCSLCRVRIDDVLVQASP